MAVAARDKTLAEREVTSPVYSTRRVRRCFERGPTPIDWRDGGDLKASPIRCAKSTRAWAGQSVSTCAVPTTASATRHPWKPAELGNRNPLNLARIERIHAAQLGAGGSRRNVSCFPGASQNGAAAMKFTLGSVRGIG